MAEFRKRFLMGLSAFVLLLGLVPAPLRAATVATSIWPSSATPAVANSTDTASVELGVKFQSNVSGTVTGIRFYKGSGNTGTHTGALWSSTGTKLASVTFAGETASGWQQASFTTPVTINANTTYVASYHAPKGHYSSDSNYFSTSAHTNGPLTALANTGQSGNGVYKYGATAAYPTTSFQSTNYWVDVAFSYNNNTPVPLAVTTVAPANNATGVAVDSNVTAQFNQAVNASTVPSAFELRDAGGVVVPANVTYNATTFTATLDPTTSLANGAAYAATVKTSLQTSAGSPLPAAYNWSFQTVAASGGSGVLQQGPGGPILVVTANGRPFTGYYAEILRAEGLNSFASADIATITPALLAAYDVVIVGDMPLTAAQVTTFSDWVTGGGNLIAMHPDKKLAGLLGLTDAASTLSDGYLQVDTSSSPGAGIVGQTMQYHDVADKYTANSGTRTIATLYSSATTATTNPAVSVRDVGTNGGQAAAFSYDLARSIVYTRQGNPAWAGQERDGMAPIRPDDLFFGAKAGDVQPDYVNLDKVAIPQADEQQRLLANMIGDMNQDRKPLPKLWYLPKDAKAVIVMAGDDHGTTNGTASTFDNLVANSPAGCNVANWECARATSWVYVASGLTNAQAANYYAQGFDIGSHVSTDCLDWTPTSLANAFTNDLAAFRAKYTSLPAQHGNRVHCIAWSDWATQPKVELSNGIRVDLNYYYWPGSWVQNRPGFFTGSGIPMRFADTDGTMIDVYQQPSHLVNESGMTFPAAIGTQLDRALGPEGYYGAFGTHYDYTDSFDRQLVQSAIARGVPLVSAQQLLDWTDGRNASYFSQLAWSGNNLNFNATADAKTGTMLRGMLPNVSKNGTLQSLTKNGAPVSFTLKTIKGVQYAVFGTDTGSYSATYSADTTAPTVTATSPANAATSVDPSANITATFSELMSGTSLTPATFELRDPAGTVVPAAISYDPNTSKATLDPASTLATNTTYTATVHGGATDPRAKDAVGNALAANVAWSFTTGAVVPVSLWPTTAPTLTGVATTDSSLVELGTRFSSDNPGTITGIRFYKGFDDASQHTVTLWNNSGAALATATTAAETPTGWQTAMFASPVAVTANIVYTASYAAPAGHYAYTTSYFAAAFANGILHAPIGAGVYQYGGGFPSASFQNTNYWVDVIFTP
jgi:hypothetical protein